jgi:hypothetical protein
MKWSVGPVQDTADSFKNFSGSGFNIINEARQPLVTFGYLSHTEAEIGRMLIVKALENAKYFGP